MLDCHLCNNIRAVTILLFLESTHFFLFWKSFVIDKFIVTMTLKTA